MKVSLETKCAGFHLQAVCGYSLLGVQLCAGVVRDVKGRLPNTNYQHLQSDFHDLNIICSQTRP